MGKISGTELYYFPAGLFNLTLLQNLDLSYNDIRGSLPADIGKDAYLVTLDLSYNELRGGYPDSMINLKVLTTLNLQNNCMTLPATLPGTLANTVAFSHLTPQFDNCNPVPANKPAVPQPTSITINSSSGSPNTSSTTSLSNAVKLGLGFCGVLVIASIIIGVSMHVKRQRRKEALENIKMAEKDGRAGNSGYGGGEIDQSVTWGGKEDSAGANNNYYGNTGVHRTGTTSSYGGYSNGSNSNGYNNNNSFNDGSNTAYGGSRNGYGDDYNNNNNNATYLKPTNLSTSSIGRRPSDFGNQFNNNNNGNNNGGVVVGGQTTTYYEAQNASPTRGQQQQQYQPSSPVTGSDNGYYQPILPPSNAGRFTPNSVPVARQPSGGGYSPASPRSPGSVVNNNNEVSYYPRSQSVYTGQPGQQQYQTTRTVTQPSPQQQQQQQTTTPAINALEWDSAQVLNFLLESGVSEDGVRKLASRRITGKSLPGLSSFELTSLGISKNDQMGILLVAESVRVSAEKVGMQQQQQR
ncbi:hypothetical protein HDU76_008035, partial [Blyttiomyces sp. JEL0837]